MIYEVFPEKSSMIINHDEIPGFMMAMTMNLKVDNSVEIERWKRGDSINFNIVIQENNGFIRSLNYIDNLEKQTGLPVTDVIRFGVEKIVHKLL